MYVCIHVYIYIYIIYIYIYISRYSLVFKPPQYRILPGFSGFRISEALLRKEHIQTRQGGCRANQGFERICQFPIIRVP